jgi:hypothetical protein
MTKRRIPTTNWRDALFNALSATKGGIDGFCSWAGVSRNRRVAPSTLYGRLDGSRPGERTPIEDAELITEYVKADINAHDMACDWIRALATRHGLVVLEVGDLPPAECKRADVERLLRKCADLFAKGGAVSGAITVSAEDNVITPREADDILPKIDDAVQLLLRARAMVVRAAEEGE